MISIIRMKQEREYTWLFLEISHTIWPGDPGVFVLPVVPIENVNDIMHT